MLYKIKKFTRDECGASQTIELMIVLPVIMAIAITFLFMFPIFTTQQTLNEQAREIAHVAEITGEVGTDVDLEINRVQSASGIIFDSIEWDTVWLDATAQTIQLHTPFTVTLTKTVSIPILQPVIGDSTPVHMVLHATASGVSEVYYKP